MDTSRTVGARSPIPWRRTSREVPRGGRGAGTDCRDDRDQPARCRHGWGNGSTPCGARIRCCRAPKRSAALSIPHRIPHPTSLPGGAGPRREHGGRRPFGGPGCKPPQVRMSTACACSIPPPSPRRRRSKPTRRACSGSLQNSTSRRTAPSTCRSGSGEPARLSRWSARARSVTRDQGDRSALRIRMPGRLRLRAQPMVVQARQAQGVGSGRGSLRLPLTTPLGPPRATWALPKACSDQATQSGSAWNTPVGSPVWV